MSNRCVLVINNIRNSCEKEDILNDIKFVCNFKEKNRFKNAQNREIAIENRLLTNLLLIIRLF